MTPGLGALLSELHTHGALRSACCLQPVRWNSICDCGDEQVWELGAGFHSCTLKRHELGISVLFPAPHPVGLDVLGREGVLAGCDLDMVARLCRRGKGEQEVPNQSQARDLLGPPRLDG